MTQARTPHKKPRLAFFSFTCCEGCQLTVLNCEDEFPDIAELVNIVNFREAIDEKSDDYDIAFIEGSVSKTEEIEKLKKIRALAKVVVSYGACSATGGINCLKNRFPIEEVKRMVYGKDAASHRLIDTIPVMPIDSVIKVDHYIYGCPILKKDFLHTLTSLLPRQKPGDAKLPGLHRL